MALEIATILTCISILLVWFKDERVWMVAYGMTVAVALFTGSIEPLGLVALAGIIGFSLLYRRGHLWALFVLIVLGAALFLHVVPGFNNAPYAENIQLSDRSTTFSIWFNYDKSAFGILLLGFLFHKTLIRSLESTKELLARVWPILMITLPTVYLLAILMSYSSWEPKNSEYLLAWSIKNIFFTVLAEEILFRGLIQTELKKRGFTVALVVGVPALLFGLAHFAGGLGYVFLSTVAGIGYGYTYHKTERIEAAILVHFLLNLGHFIFFTYPSMAL